MKKIAKYILLSIFNICIFSSCIVYDFKHTTEIVYAPQMETTFNKMSAPVELKNAEVYIFDNQNFLVSHAQLTAQQLQGGTPITLIKGANEGEYTMLAYYNTQNLRLSELKVGSKIDEVTAGLKFEENPAVPGHFTYQSLKDSLCFSRDKFIIQRGHNKTVLDSKISHSHFAYNFSVEGLNQVSGSLGEITIQLKNVPTSLGELNTPAAQLLDHMVELENVDPENQYSDKKGKYLSMSYTKENSVSLLLFEDNKQIQNLALNPDHYIDEESKNVLNVRVVFSVDTYIIMINDWYQEFENHHFGG